MHNLQSTDLTHLILDIDSTLVHSVKLVHPEWAKKFNTIKSDEYHIFIRPHVTEFLEYISKNYTIGIFSAGESHYVNFIVKEVIQKYSNIQPKFILSKDDFDICKYESGDIKSLDWVSQKYPEFNKQNTLIIDDYVLVKNSNPNNTYLIKAFEVCNEVKSSIELNNILKADNMLILLERLYRTDAEKDTELLKLIDILRNHT
jgi:hypothetical protein